MKKYDYKILKDKLEKCKNIDLKTITENDIDDINDIKIDRRKSSNERILDFLSVVKNPYVFKINGRIVRMRFSDTELTADDCLTNMLKNLYR
jgi:hypothetical protein